MSPRMRVAAAGAGGVEDAGAAWAAGWAVAGAGWPRAARKEVRLEVSRNRLPQAQLPRTYRGSP